MFYSPVFLCSNQNNLVLPRYGPIGCCQKIIRLKTSNFVDSVVTPLISKIDICDIFNLIL